MDTTVPATESAVEPAVDAAIETKTELADELAAAPSVADEPATEPPAQSDTKIVSDQYLLIDEYMRDKDHWVCLQDGKCINPKDGSDAFIDMPETWATFDEAHDYIGQNPGSMLGYQLGRDSNITAIHFGNCLNADGTISGDKMKEIYKTWEDGAALSFVEYDVDGSGLWFLFKNTPVTQRYGYTAQDNELTVTITDSYACIPITGNYYEEQGRSQHEFKLASGKDVLACTYEQFFGVAKDTEPQSNKGEIDDSLAGINIGDPLKRRLTALLDTNKYFNNLWNRTTPTERGKNADEIEIVARIMHYVSDKESIVCTIFKASPYFRMKPKTEQTYYENLFDPEKYDADIVSGSSEEPAEPDNDMVPDKSKDEMPEFASPYMRKLLDKAKEVINIKNFTENNYDNDIDLIYDPLFETVKIPDTDVACAKILLKAYGDRMKYCTEDGCWYIYNGAYWEREDNRSFEHIRKFGEILTERLSLIPTWFDMPPIKKRQLTKQANRFSNVSSLNKIVEAARSVDPVGPDFFNAEINKLAVGNGTIDLEKGLLFGHNPKDYFTTHTDVRFEGCYPRPRQFEKFLNDVFRNDNELIEYVRRVLGYCITGETKEQKLFVFYGTGGNGKSTLINILQEVLNDYAGNFDAYALASKDDGAGKANPTLIQNRYSRLVIVSEKGENTYLDISLIKAITGGDKINARMLFQNNSEPFRPRYKLILTANRYPNVDWSSESIARRFKIIPFKADFTNKNADPEIGNKILATEKEMILKWLVDAAKDYLSYGLGDEPEAVKVIRENAKLYATSVKDYADDQLKVTHNFDDYIHVDELYAKYAKWCTEKSRSAKNKQQFKKELIRRLHLPDTLKVTTDPDRCYSYVGIKYKLDDKSSVGGKKGKRNVGGKKAKPKEKRSSVDEKPESNDESAKPDAQLNANSSLPGADDDLVNA